MPKGSPERTSARKEEIVKACEQLYQTMSFREINLKEIGKVTSFTRTSIYNYFQTKEEIFLELLKREYELWIDELSKFFPDMELKEQQDFIYEFFPFIYGIYPYTRVTEKQKEAMEQAGVNYVYQSIYEITFQCLMQLLPDKK